MASFSDSLIVSMVCLPEHVAYYMVVVNKAGNLFNQAPIKLPSEGDEPEKYCFIYTPCSVETMRKLIEFKNVIKEIFDDDVIIHRGQN